MTDLEMAKRFEEAERERVLDLGASIAQTIGDYAQRVRREVSSLAEGKAKADDVGRLINEVENMLRNLNLSTLARASVAWAVAEQRVACLGNKE